MGLGALQHVGSSRTRDWTCVSCIGRQILYCWATRKALRLILMVFLIRWSRRVATQMLKPLLASHELLSHLPKWVMCLVPQFMWRGTVQGTDGGGVSIVIILQAIYCSIKRVSTVSGTLKKEEHTKIVTKISNNRHNYFCCMEKHFYKANCHHHRH